MASTTIEWTQGPNGEKGMVWNPVTGCTKVSPGCKNCYAEDIAVRFWGKRKFTDIICHEDRLEHPLHWKKPRMIFVNSMSDLFHEDVPLSFINEVWSIMKRTESIHTYQILTKRPERMNKLLLGGNYVLKNVWLGVSVENQKTADERREYLRQTPASIRWVSYEPALEKINWKGWEFIDWLVAGGESGAKKRPCDLEWFRYSKAWAEAHNVKFFMKQVDKVQPIPGDLRIREYPNGLNKN